MKSEIIVGMTVEAPVFVLSQTPPLRETFGKEDSPETGERQFSLERTARHSSVALGREEARCW